MFGTLHIQPEICYTNMKQVTYGLSFEKKIWEAYVFIPHKHIRITSRSLNCWLRTQEEIYGHDFHRNYQTSRGFDRFLHFPRRNLEELLNTLALEFCEILLCITRRQATIITYQFSIDFENRKKFRNICQSVRGIWTTQLRLNENSHIQWSWDRLIHTWESGLRLMWKK